MMQDNKSFQAFRVQLAARGVEFRWAWVAKGEDVPPVGMLHFSGQGFQPKHLTAIVVDYGRDGFGLFLETGKPEIAADADEIAGPNAHFPDATALADGLAKVA